MVKRLNLGHNGAGVTRVRVKRKSYDQDLRKNDVLPSGPRFSHLLHINMRKCLLKAVNNPANSGGLQ